MGQTGPVGLSRRLVTAEVRSGVARDCEERRATF